MKKTLLFCTFLLLALFLAAQDNPITDYFNNPNPQTFETAWNFCNSQLAEDSTQVDVKILMANLAVIESKRLADEVTPLVENLEVGGKFQYANLLLAQNRFEAAIDVYETINQDYPGWSCPWRHKGQALYSLKRYKDAEKSIAKAIETNAEHYDAYIWMARIQYKLKKYKPALKNLEIAMSLNPESEESPDEAISADSIRALHEALLKKTGKLK
jgi:tetratricopeptide (TPR) repeat protein